MSAAAKNNRQIGIAMMQIFYFITSLTASLSNIDAAKSPSRSDNTALSIAANPSIFSLIQKRELEDKQRGNEGVK